MRKHFFTLLLSTLAFIGFGQGNLECPDDVTVHLFDLDSEYNSYGEPSYDNTFELRKHITTIDNSCSSNFQLEVTLSYSLFDSASNSEVNTCNQKIFVERATLEDITFPEDYEIADGVIEDLTPEYAGQPEPYDVIAQYSLLAITYHDDVFNSGPGLKVIRTWTALDWCTGNTSQHAQLLNIGTVISRATNVLSCTNELIETEDLVVRTDVVGYSVDYGTCSTEGNTLLEFVNCVAANNDIPANNSFILELSKEGDDLNGVSTLDIVLTQRHILGIEPLDDACSLLSADINSDGNISAIDLVESRKLILGIYNNFPQSPSWKFYNQKQMSNNTLGPLTDDTDLKFGKSEFPLSELNVIAVKVGDVNGSAIGN